MPTKMERGHPVRAIIDEFTRKILSGDIRFSPANWENLSYYGRINMGLVLHAKLAWELGDLHIGNSYAVRINSNVIRYIIFHDSYRLVGWYGPDLGPSIHGDEVVAYLLHCHRPDLSRVQIEDTLDMQARSMGLPMYFANKRKGAS